MVKRSTLDSAFGALADPTRRAIIERLARGEASVMDLARPHDISLPAISKHLGVLERAGLISRTKEGRVRRCRLKPRAMRDASRWLDRYRIFWEGQLDALGAFLAQEKEARR